MWDTHTFHFNTHIWKFIANFHIFCSLCNNLYVKHQGYITLEQESRVPVLCPTFQRNILFQNNEKHFIPNSSYSDRFRFPFTCFMGKIRLEKIFTHSPILNFLLTTIIHQRFLFFIHFLTTTDTNNTPTNSKEIYIWSNRGKSGKRLSIRYSTPLHVNAFVPLVQITVFFLAKNWRALYTFSATYTIVYMPLCHSCWVYQKSSFMFYNDTLCWARSNAKNTICC